MNKETIEVWTTKEGITLPIKDMSDQHLLNTINFLFKQAKTMKTQLADHLEMLGWSTMEYSCTTEAEMASYYASHEADGLFAKAEDARNETRTIVNDKIPFLIKEANKRKLSMPLEYTHDWVTVTAFMNDDYEEPDCDNDLREHR
jgi:hypothetical protein